MWQICQQSLKIISIEQSFVRGNYTFSELCSSRKYPYPPPATPPPPPSPRRTEIPRGGGVQKEVISEELVGCRCLQRFFNPSPVTRYPSPATRHLSPATRHPAPAEKSCRASDANPQTERLSDKKKLRVKENDDVKVAFGFFYISRE